MALQVLNIPTKINKGTVEITSNVALIKAGEKVGASEATLLAKLGIKPFSYGLIVQNVSPPSCCPLLSSFTRLAPLAPWSPSLWGWVSDNVGARCGHLLTWATGPSRVCRGLIECRVQKFPLVNLYLIGPSYDLLPGSVVDVRGGGTSGDCLCAPGQWHHLCL